MNNFLKIAADELFTYRTPQRIIDYIQSERLKVIIGNPPFTKFEPNKKIK